MIQQVEAALTSNATPDDLMLACAKPSGAIAEEDFLLVQALRIADDHRQCCIGEACAISLHSLAMLLKRAGIEIPQVLRSRFM